MQVVFPLILGEQQNSNFACSSAMFYSSRSWTALVGALEGLERTERAQCQGYDMACTLWTYR